jgi:hypothetical protein
VRYRADITAGSLKVPESRAIARMLLSGLSEEAWHTALYKDNVLQARSPKTAARLALLLRGRLEAMDAGLWRLIRDGSQLVATHACLAAAIKHSALLGDFMDSVMRTQYRVFSPQLSRLHWEHYLADCRARDPKMPAWSESTIDRLRSTVFQILAQGGYIDNTRTKNLQTVHIAREVVSYLQAHDQHYVLRCIQVSP